MPLNTNQQAILARSKRSASVIERHLQNCKQMSSSWNLIILNKDLMIGGGKKRPGIVIYFHYSLKGGRGGEIIIIGVEENY